MATPDPSRPCMVTAALSGVVANRDQCPAIPYTPEEYAAEARRAWEAGAACVHIHARTPDGLPSFEVQDYQAIRDAIVAVCPVVVNFSTGAVGVSVAKRLAYVQEVKPAVAALNMGSMNYAKYNAKKKRFVFDFVFTNPHAEIIELVEGMRAVGVRPEMECFDSGHIGSIGPLMDMGLLDAPHLVSLVMGVVGGMPGTVDAMLHAVRLLPEPSDWQVIGISQDQWRLLAGAAAVGGNVRVGLEDNFYVSPGVMARSNGELVEKAVRMVRDMGREVATVEQCRERMRLTHA